MRIWHDDPIAGADDLIVAIERDAADRLAPDGMPIRGYNYGQPIPDLRQIPRERWREVLAPLRHATRQRAMNTAATPADVGVAAVLVGELLHAEPGPGTPQTSTPPGMPAAATPALGARRQIAFRLGPDEYARLSEAARLYGMRPTTLARALAVQGAERVLYERRRDR